MTKRIITLLFALHVQRNTGLVFDDEHLYTQNNNNNNDNNNNNNNK